MVQEILPNLLLSTLTKVTYACKLMKPNYIPREIVGWLGMSPNLIN